MTCGMGSLFAPPDLCRPTTSLGLKQPPQEAPGSPSVKSPRSKTGCTVPTPYGPPLRFSSAAVSSHPTRLGRPAVAAMELLLTETYCPTTVFPWAHSESVSHGDVLAGETNDGGAPSGFWPLFYPEESYFVEHAVAPTGGLIGSGLCQLQEQAAVFRSLGGLFTALDVDEQHCPINEGDSPCASPCDGPLTPPDPEAIHDIPIYRGSSLTPLPVAGSPEPSDGDGFSGPGADGDSTPCCESPVLQPSRARCRDRMLPAPASHPQPDPRSALFPLLMPGMPYTLSGPVVEGI